MNKDPYSEEAIQAELTDVRTNIAKIQEQLAPLLARELRLRNALAPRFGRREGEFQEHSIRSRILTALSNGPMTMKDLSECLGVQKESLYVALHRLYKANRVSRLSQGLYALPDAT